MPSTDDLQKMYYTTKIVLHERLAEELARAVGNRFSENGQHQDLNDYFRGKFLSDICDGYRTRRLLANADVTPHSFEFQREFWYQLVSCIGVEKFTGFSPHDIHPVRVIVRDGLYDVAIDIPAAISVYRATAL